MGTAVSFPGLGLEFSLSREAFSIGPLTIYWYGIIVVTGILLGVWYAVWRAGQFGIDRDRMFDTVLYSVLAGIVGARIYFVAFSWDYYSQHPEEIIAIWKGGIAFYGGLIGALLCAWLLTRRWKIPLVQGMDAALGGLLLGQSIGRWGNFVNIEAFGCYFEGQWRMVSPAIDLYFHQNPALLPGFSAEQVMAMENIPVHPTFFYESAWTMLGFFFLLWYTKRRSFTGELTLFYFFWNGLGRSVIEGLRTDSLTMGNLRVSQVLAIAMVAGSVILWWMAKNRQKQGKAPAWMALPSQGVAATDAAESACAEIAQAGVPVAPLEAQEPFDVAQAEAPVTPIAKRDAEEISSSSEEAEDKGTNSGEE